MEEINLDIKSRTIENLIKKTASSLPSAIEEPSDNRKEGHNTDTAKQVLSETGSKNTGSVEEEEIRNIAESLNKFLESIQTDLKVEIHKETNTAIFKIVKRENNEVITEVPPKKLLDIEVKIREMVGALFDESA